MITLSGQLICATEAEAAVVAALLPDHIRLTRAEPGCLSFDVVQGADPLTWTVRETFVDGAAFEAHQARSRATPWASGTAQIRRDYRVTGL